MILHKKQAALEGYTEWPRTCEASNSVILPQKKGKAEQ